jgi:DNA-binding IclR family transcriptional regulator
MLDSLAITPSTVDRRNPAARQTLLQRVSAEFQEMPGMRLTAGQARRLFGLRSDVCHRILSTLVRQGTLSCDGERYRYNDARTWPLPHVAEAHAGVRLRAS